MAGLEPTTSTLADPMVSAEWLADNIKRADVIALDATCCMPGESPPYSGIFIEGVFLDIDVVADEQSALPHMLPTAEKFQEHVRAMGINSETIVVCYDRHGLFSAPRAWWMFRAMGHRNVCVLDGGLPEWIKKKYPTVANRRAAGNGNFLAALNPHLVRDLDSMRQSLSGGKILDARPAGRFDGTMPEPRAGISSGHMPGAVSVPFSSLITENGLLKSKAELIEVFDGIDFFSPIVATCGSGITACGIALALARLGVWNAAVYDGSWTEWASTPSCPIKKAG